MCGIFGVVAQGEAKLDPASVQHLTNRLFLLSESRGKEASGLTLIPSIHSDRIYVVKSPRPASELIKHRQYQQLMASAFRNGGGRGTVAFGHTRLVTNGSQIEQSNNQPVIYEGGVMVHNGIIVNVDELWSRHSDLRRESDVDTEIIVALVRKFLRIERSPTAAVRRAFHEIRGTASIATAFSDLDAVVLATNNGSLYLAHGGPREPLLFASEKHTLKRVLEESPKGADFASYAVEQIHSNDGLLIDLGSGARTLFSLNGESKQEQTLPFRASRVVETSTIGSPKADSLRRTPSTSVPHHLERGYDAARDAVAQLKRCSRCVLAETVPFISFDGEGVCNFCRSYKPIALKGRVALERMLSKYRRPGRQPDCVAALSGGRDSCYGLHLMVRELGLKPITYVYDWGMVTDLARRNISRMCSQLGVENIIISADIAAKRENIRKNVVAWLKKPHLGMVPLFMAGDKQFIWYSQRVKKQNGLELDIFTFNLMEKTQFKEEYSGIRMWEGGADSDQLGEYLRLGPRLRLAAFYSKEFLTNREYLNRSMIDTFYGYLAYYFVNHTFVPLFQYLPWREDEVVGLLREKYDWELAPDTETTWRIGDGTAPFYNYIYYVLGGFTENDTLRANQVREGHLTREQALELTARDNQPRWESIKWYCDIVGLDFVPAVERINEFRLRS